MIYDSTIDTNLHIDRVRFLLGQCAIFLLERGARHDASKLEEPEKAVFDAVGNRLDGGHAQPRALAGAARLGARVLLRVKRNRLAKKGRAGGLA